MPLSESPELENALWESQLFPRIGRIILHWRLTDLASWFVLSLQTEKPIDGEIIIDVPKALGMMFMAGGWPVLAFREWQNGTLFEKDDAITVSPR